jgi:hypothetical protein
MKERILINFYGLSTVITVSVTLLLCFLFNWTSDMLTIATTVSLVVSLPFTILLHLLLNMVEKVQVARVVFWIILLAPVPLLAFIPAGLFSQLVPGDTWFLVVLGMVAAYTAIFTNGISITEIFNSSQNETR